MNVVNASRSAYLEIIIGPMFSGKTSKLVQIYKQYKLCNIPVLVINHSNDILRNVVENQLVNHDNIHIPCICVNTLTSVCTEDYNVILINEAQFFTDLVTFVKNQLKLKKTIYIAGLDGDFQRNIFGDILQLIPLCDKIEKLCSLCGICKNGEIGIFSKRISNETTQTLIGGINKYVPVCRTCYEKNDIEDFL
jgi:thymidine kinase